MGSFPLLDVSVVSWDGEVVVVWWCNVGFLDVDVEDNACYVFLSRSQNSLMVRFDCWIVFPITDYQSRLIIKKFVFNTLFIRN